MNQHNNLKDIDVEFAEKVSVIADEVLNILQELSQENKDQINSTMIAEKMCWKDSVQKVLLNPNGETTESNIEIHILKDISHIILDKIYEIIPHSMKDEFSNFKDTFNTQANIDDYKNLLDSPIKVIKKYINNQNIELKEFMQQTMGYFANVEDYLASELSSKHQDFKNDRDFEENISANINMINQDINISVDLKNIKIAVKNKIDNIHEVIKRKREKDLLRLSESETTIQKMGEQIANIKREADEIRKRAQEIELDSVHDNLTKLFNRKAYDEKIMETLAHLGRYNVPSSLMLCDIDKFKTINDTFGHKVGDLALIKIADLFRESLRKNDFISRYGGEEFAIILPHTTLKNAVIAGEKMRSYIEKSVFSYKNQIIPLTISIGVSFFRKGDDSNTVFERADKAIYLAKKSGRNTVKTEDDVTE